MRKFLALLFFIFSSIILCPAQQTAQISFESYRYSLGTFARNDANKTYAFKFKNTGETYAFKFKNTGDAKLVIDHLSVGCPCTTAKYSKKTFLPGESGEILATFDGSHQSLGAFEIEIIVASNATSKYVRLFLAGNLVATQEDVVDVQQSNITAAADTSRRQDSWFRRFKGKLSNLFKNVD